MDEKKWELMHKVTKHLIAGLISGLLLGGSVVMGLCVGYIAYAIQVQGGHTGGEATLFGVVTGAAAYCAGIAGRDFANRNFLVKLRPKLLEVPDEGPKAD